MSKNPTLVLQSNELCSRSRSCTRTYVILDFALDCVGRASVVLHMRVHSAPSTSHSLPAAFLRHANFFCGQSSSMLMLCAASCRRGGIIFPRLTLASFANYGGVLQLRQVSHFAEFFPQYLRTYPDLIKCLIILLLGTVL